MWTNSNTWEVSCHQMGPSAKRLSQGSARQANPYWPSTISGDGQSKHQVANQTQSLQSCGAH